MPERIVVAGVASRPAMLSARVMEAMSEADLVVGGSEPLDAVRALAADVLRLSRTMTLSKDIGSVLDAIGSEPGLVCVLASGDPGFFGILGPLSSRFDPRLLEVHPGASSVSLAFARLGLPWDDAVVVSAHGRPLQAALARLEGAAKAAVLVSPENPPEAIGKGLVAGGARARRVSVCSRLGTDHESVEHTDLEGLAAGTWDPRSVVVLLEPSALRPHARLPALSWGLCDSVFEHSGGMITRSEVRAVALGKLDIPWRGVMWDVGAGSASVAIEATRLAPGLDTYAIERDGHSVERARRNAAACGVELRVVHGEAPAALGGLPDPDRVFVGGGGIEVLDEVLRRLRAGGRVVATYAALERAAQAASRLGELVQLSTARGLRLPDGGLRLSAENPVFVVWGPGR